MKLSATEYNQSVESYNRKWRVLDETLYRICREHPGHQDEAVVNAKAWIIGRTYATGIERAIRSTQEQGSSLSKLALCLQQHSTKVDEIFGRLGEIDEPLTPDKLLKIVELHGGLIKLLSRITRKNMSPRSFVSKYMHFHTPVVPIFDGFADRKLKRLARWSKSIDLFKIPTGCDSYYGWYVMRFFQVYEAVRSSGLPLSIKLVDNYLLS